MGVSKATTAAVVELKYLATIKELNLFLALSKLFYRFAYNFRRMAAPLNKKVREISLASHVYLPGPKRM